MISKISKILSRYESEVSIAYATLVCQTINVFYQNAITVFLEEMFLDDGYRYLSVKFSQLGLFKKRFHALFRTNEWENLRRQLETLFPYFSLRTVNRLPDSRFAKILDDACYEKILTHK
jgi:hypothetical protein